MSNKQDSTLQKKQQLDILKEKLRKSNAFLKNLFLIMIIITVIYCVDEITSNINLMRPYMIYDLFKIPN